jgi:hypothetical protein
MKLSTLNKAVLEARRFLQKATEYQKMYDAAKFDAECHGRKFYGPDSNKESAAAKRASMDLSRELANLRQGR